MMAGYPCRQASDQHLNRQAMPILQMPIRGHAALPKLSTPALQTCISDAATTTTETAPKAQLQPRSLPATLAGHHLHSVTT